MTHRARLEPVLLLFGAGICIGSIFPLGKIAVAAGIPSLVYVGATAAGAGVVLTAIARLAGHSLRPDRAILRYAAIAGLLTFAIPWTAVVTVMPHLGAGIPAIIQSLAPIATLAIVYALALEKPNVPRLVGLGIGMIGTLVILFARNGGGGAHAPFYWYLAALITPVVLAAGNVYRTTHWPKGKHPLPLAAWTLAAAALGIAVTLSLFIVTGAMPGFAAALANGWHLIAMQCVATGVGYGLFFRLQQVGGPVYVSQMSYVNTAVGVGFGVMLFAESLSLWIWLALALIVIGVLLVNRVGDAVRS
ncbi:DMT family transporter [Mesorhizobium sp. CC13]|uniref:DMT family transporter n=1 Tax=Mesorhizobium sp. CC13 TaxID=3029194 RepID=UPI0032678261